MLHFLFNIYHDFRNPDRKRCRAKELKEELEQYEKRGFLGYDSFFFNWCQCQNDLKSGHITRTPCHLFKGRERRPYAPCKKGEVYWSVGYEWFRKEQDNSIWILEHPGERYYGSYYRIKEDSFYESKHALESIGTFESYYRRDTATREYYRQLIRKKTNPSIPFRDLTSYLHL